MRCQWLILSVVMGGMTVLASAQFRGEMSCPDLGLRIKELASSQVSPLPSPVVYPVTITHGNGVVEKKELLSLREMWMLTQCKLRLEDKEGNVLSVGVPSAKPASSVESTELSVDGEMLLLTPRPACEKALERAQRQWSAAPQDEESLAQWAAEFAGAKLGAAQKIRGTLGAKRILYFPSSKVGQNVWLFSTRTSGAAGWFGLVVESVRAPATTKKNVETQFFGGLRVLPGAGMQAKRKGRGHESINSTLLAKSSIANMDGWWSAQAPGYLFLSNVKSSHGKKMMRRLQRELPVMRRMMEQLIPGDGNVSDVCVVRVFADAAAYRSYVGAGQEWSSGCWIPMRRELVALYQNAQGRQSEVEILNTLHHECLHQYLFYALQQNELSLWYNEGHACLFENSHVDARERVIFEKDTTWHYKLIRSNLSKAALLLPRVLEMDHAAFYAGGEKERALKYAIAWGVVYFLYFGQKQYPRYSQILSRYRQALLETGNCKTANEIAFKEINRNRFASDFITYWSTGRKR